jgi:hypothetical protein
MQILKHKDTHFFKKNGEHIIVNLTHTEDETIFLRGLYSVWWEQICSNSDLAQSIDQALRLCSAPANRNTELKILAHHLILRGYLTSQNEAIEEAAHDLRLLWPEEFEVVILTQETYLGHAPIFAYTGPTGDGTDVIPFLNIENVD